MNFKNKKKVPFQALWGAALVLMGVAVFFRVPDIMAKVSHIGHFASLFLFIRFSFYLMSILLIGGGIKKLYGIITPRNLKKSH